MIGFTTLRDGELAALGEAPDNPHFECDWCANSVDENETCQLPRVGGGITCDWHERCYSDYRQYCRERDRLERINKFKEVNL